MLAPIIIPNIAPAIFPIGMPAKRIPNNTNTKQTITLKLTRLVPIVKNTTKKLNTKRAVNILSPTFEINFGFIKPISCLPFNKKVIIYQNNSYLEIWNTKKPAS